MRRLLLENLRLKLLAVATAVFLWSVVIGEQKADLALNVPLEVRNVPDHLMLVGQPLEGVTVRLRGPKTLVAGLTPREVRYVISGEGFREGKRELDLRPEGVQVPRGIEVLEVSPSRAQLALEAETARELEVAPRIEGTPASGYQLRRAVPSPSRVRVAGPRSEVKRLGPAVTLPINVDGQSRGFMVKTILEPLEKPLRVLDPGPITVTIEIGRRRS